MLTPRHRCSIVAVAKRVMWPSPTDTGRRPSADACRISQLVIMTMRLRMPYVPTARLPQRNNRHIPCACEHTGLTRLMLLR